MCKWIYLLLFLSAPPSLCLTLLMYGSVWLITLSPPNITARTINIASSLSQHPYIGAPLSPSLAPSALHSLRSSFAVLPSVWHSLAVPGCLQHLPCCSSLPLGLRDDDNDDLGLRHWPLPAPWPLTSPNHVGNDDLAIFSPQVMGGARVRGTTSIIRTYFIFAPKRSNILWLLSRCVHSRDGLRELDFYGFTINMERGPGRAT